MLLLHTNNLELLKRGGNVQELSLVKVRYNAVGMANSSLFTVELQLSNLQVLDLHHNRLTSLPANIGAMTSLQVRIADIQ